MPNDKPYIPLDERVHQDLIHDNFVPKYSALATARPTRLVLIGVWLLFGAWPIAAVAMVWDALTGNAEIIGRLFDAFVGVLIFFISTVNLTRVTRGYLQAKRTTRERADERAYTRTIRGQPQRDET